VNILKRENRKVRGVWSIAGSSWVIRQDLKYRAFGQQESRQARKQAEHN
jgi:hypothetical protein